MKASYSILVIGAEADVRDKVAEALDSECDVRYIETLDESLGTIDHPYDAVILDGSSNDVDTLEVLGQWKLRQPATPFLFLVNRNEVRLAVEAMKQGAVDCLETPIDADDLRAVVPHLLGLRSEMNRDSSEREGDRGANQGLAIEIPPNTSLEDLERAAVEQALVQHAGNRTHAARALGISVRTLQRKLKAWGMPIVSFPSVTTGNFTLPGATGTPYSYSVHAH